MIDLKHSPSHGRHLAMWIRSQGAIRAIPIVFVDGDPERVKRIQAELPDAIYSTRAKLAAALRGAKPLAGPAVGYGNRTIAQKLGIPERTRVALIDPPPDYARLFRLLPTDASLEVDEEETLPITLWFVRDSHAFFAGLKRMRALVAAGSRLGIIFPKRHGAHQRQGRGFNVLFIQESTKAIGLVPFRVCSVSSVWSAILFALGRGRS